MFADIDVADVQSHSVCVRFSLDKSLLQEIGLAARQHQMGRSAYIARVCADELAHEGYDRALLRFSTRLPDLLRRGAGRELHCLLIGFRFQRRER